MEAAVEVQAQVTAPPLRVGVIVQVTPAMPEFTPEAAEYMVAVTTPFDEGAATDEYLPAAVWVMLTAPVQVPATWHCSAIAVFVPSISVKGSDVWPLAT